MRLSIKTTSPQVIGVSSDWTNYTVVFSENIALVTSFGLEQECSIEHFPDSAKNAAIAAFLVAQIELTSLE